MTDVYASRAELRALVGAGANADLDTRLDWTLIAATLWVRYRVGDDVATDDADITTPGTLTVVATTAAKHAATLAAATRFWKSPEVPFGVMGMGDYGVTVKTSIPEAEALLVGQKSDFGFA
jgi:hypothetical protein